MMQPAQWKSGMIEVQRSSGVTQSLPEMPHALAIMPAWVSSAPLGNPVVPEVYCSEPTASGSTSGSAVAPSRPSSDQPAVIRAVERDQRLQIRNAVPNCADVLQIGIAAKRARQEQPARLRSGPSA